MPSNFETDLFFHALKHVVRLALAVVACAGLAGCGGGSGSGDQVMITPGPEERPGLVLESPSVSDADPPAGEPFSLSVTVRNAGDGRVAAVTLRFYRSDDAVVTPSDTEVGVDEVGELAPSESHAASVELAAPSTSGIYYYGACVDAVNDESDTANNCSPAVRITVSGSRPDLVVASLSVSDANPAAGADFTLSATVRNAGGAAAATTTLRFYRSDDAAITTSDEEVGDATVAELAASGSVVASVELSASSTPGTYYYGACVDEVAGESDTGNNCSAAVRVTVRKPQFPVSDPQIVRPGSQSPPPNLPDLVAVWVSHDSPAIGGFFKLSVRVRNPWLRKSAPTTVRVYRSTDPAFAASVAQAHVFWVRGLNARYNSTEQAFLKAPSSKGEYYYRACRGAASPKSGAANDCLARVKVEVSHDKPNLLIHGRGASSPRYRGGPFTLTAHVRNFGGPSAATTLRFLRVPSWTSPPSLGMEVAAVAVPALVTPFQRSLHVGGGFQGAIRPMSPSTRGKYYYVACVDAVPDESDTKDNCSTRYSIRVP